MKAIVSIIWMALTALFFVNSTALAKGFNLPDLWPYHVEGCMNTKDMHLRTTTNTSRLTYTKVRKNNCHIKTGKWTDAFSGVELKRSSDIIVAPIIPLSHLKHLNVQWSNRKIMNYVQDQGLLIHFKKDSASETSYLKNSTKLTALPKTFAQKCEFYGMWIDTKSRWSIPFQKGEKAKIGKALLNCLKESSYNRDETFGDWIRVQGHSCDARVEVLRRDGGKWSPMYEDDKKCTGFLNGKWEDMYTGNIFKESTGMDIDHVVPLKNAFRSGAWRWPRWKKRKYANYLDDPFHLLAVDLSENRSKGDDHPGEYMPPNRAYHCEYLKTWVGIKFKWHLGMEKSEASAILSKIKTCKGIKMAEYKRVIDFLRSPAD